MIPFNLLWSDLCAGNALRLNVERSVIRSQDAFTICFNLLWSDLCAGNALSSTFQSPGLRIRF